MIRFDRSRLASELQRLPIAAGGAFAAAATSRIVPAYVVYCRLTKKGNAEKLREALSFVWEFVEGTCSDRKTLQRQLTVATALTDVPDAPWSKYLACAQDATAAVAYSIKYLLNHDVRDAARAAYRSYDASYQYALLARASGIQVASVSDTERWISDPLVQTELMRQERDLTLLKNANSVELREAIRNLHSTSERECVVPLECNTITGSEWT